MLDFIKEVHRKKSLFQGRNKQRMMKLVLLSTSILLFACAEMMCPTTDWFHWRDPAVAQTLKPEGLSNAPKGQRKTEQELFFILKSHLGI